jgi:hypothetical protein
MPWQPLSAENGPLDAYFVQYAGGSYGTSRRQVLGRGGNSIGRVATETIGQERTDMARSVCP